jgi:hypothetical protein
MASSVEITGKLVSGNDASNVVIHWFRKSSKWKRPADPVFGRTSGPQLAG